MTTSVPENTRGFYLAVIAGICAASQGAILLPFWMGVSIDALQLSETQGGWLASAQLAAGALATFSIAPFVNRVDKRRAFRAGLLFSALGNGLSILALTSGALPMLFVCRMLCGIGEGLLVAIVSAAAATTAKPIRTFTLMNCAGAAIAATVFFTSPFLMATFGPATLFGIMLTIALLAFPFSGKIGAAKSATAIVATPIKQRLLSPQSLLALIMFGLFAGAIGGTFAFSQRIGINSVGLPMDEIGLIIGIAAVVMISGPLLANHLGNRFGQSLPITSVIIVYAVVAFCFAFTDNLPLYVFAVMGHAVAAGFATTFLSAFLASLDSSGRVVAAAPAFAGIGNAAGPSLVASSIPLFPGYQAIGWVAGAILLVVGVGFLLLAPGRETAT